MTEHTKKPGDRLTELEGQVGKITSDMARLADRIPEKLSESVVGFNIKLDRLVTDVESLSKTIKEDFVSRTEFEVLRVEHNQIKRLIYGFITLVLTGVVGALLGLVISKGGL